MERAGGPVTVIKATPPLGPVQGKAPIIFALPALVGHRDRLREQLPEAFRGRPDAVFLIPVTNDKNAVVWRVFWEKGAIKLIEEYNAFSDAKTLVDSGLGDEDNRARILSRLSDPAFVAVEARLTLPADIATYTLMPMPAEGVSVPCTQYHQILSIAERDPTYFDLAATHFNSSTPAIIESVNYNRKSNKGGLSHSGDVNFTSNGGDVRNPGKALQVLGHSVGSAGSAAFAVTVSGYNRTALVKFEKWRPTVAAIDHESKTIYYIGVRLDSATAGSNTVCVVMLCSAAQKNRFHVTPLPGPYDMGDINGLPPALFKGLVDGR